MPMIDVYAREDLFPPGTDRRLGEELTLAVLRAEGVKKPGPFHLNNTAAYIHRMDPKLFIPRRKTLRELYVYRSSLLQEHYLATDKDNWSRKSPK